MKSPAKPNSYRVGLMAEAIAMLLLACKFYRIIAIRYKTRMGEIDIIAMRGRTLVFIEVKKRKKTGDVFESIRGKQQKRIVKAAEIFLAKNHHFHNHKKRFDAILITSNLFPVHIKGAWES